MNVQWFRLRSWHIASGLVSRANHPRSLCGKWGLPPTVDERPANEKTCETCLRIGGPR